MEENEGLSRGMQVESRTDAELRSPETMLRRGETTVTMRQKS